MDIIELTEMSEDGIRVTSIEVDQQPPPRAEIERALQGGAGDLYLDADGHVRPDRRHDLTLRELVIVGNNMAAWLAIEVDSIDLDSHRGEFAERLGEQQARMRETLELWDRLIARLRDRERSAREGES